MNLSEMLLTLNLHKGISETGKLTNALVAEQLTQDLKEQTYPLLMNNEGQKAVETDAFITAIRVLLFDGKKIKPITEAVINAIGFVLTNEQQEEMKTTVQAVVKFESNNFKKKVHKPWILDLVDEKEAEAKALLAARTN